MLRHKAGLLRTDFTQKLGKVSYHVPCHLRVQNIGLKTRDVLRLVPDTTVEVDRALLGPQRHLRGEEGIPRGVGEDRQAGGVEAWSRPRPITTRATARWPGTRSKADFAPMQAARRRASPNIR